MITINNKVYTLEELLELRTLIEKGINHLKDEDAVAGATLFPLWDSLLAENHVFTQEEVDTGFRCQYEGVLYKVLQPHTVQESWTPKDAPSLFAKVLIPDDNTIYPWEQPESTNLYMKDDKVTHNGKVWESQIDNNSWEPGIIGTETLWVEVTE